eukprot:scaffold282276_cov27-Tisochrysis_lutea.AAC.1
MKIEGKSRAPGKRRRVCFAECGTMSPAFVRPNWWVRGRGRIACLRHAKFRHCPNSVVYYHVDDKYILNVLSQHSPLSGCVGCLRPYSVIRDAIEPSNTSACLCMLCGA